MQYWILFQPGVGGDGFSNLLEHADNVYCADGKDKYWRIHKRVTNAIKFYPAQWADPLPFKVPEAVVDTTFHPAYESIVQDGRNTIICAHPDVYFRDIIDFPKRHFIQKDQVKIHLYSSDPERVALALENKIGPINRKDWHINMDFRTSLGLRNKQYNAHIEIERAWRDWHYLQGCLDQFGLKLDKATWNEYKELVGTDAG